MFVGAVTPLAWKIRERPWTEALLDGVNAAALGLIAGITFQLTVDALAGPLTVAIALTAALLLWRTRLNGAWLIAAVAVTGLISSP